MCSSCRLQLVQVLRPPAPQWRIDALLGGIGMAIEGEHYEEREVIENPCTPGTEGMVNAVTEKLFEL